MGLNCQNLVFDGKVFPEAGYAIRTESGSPRRIVVDKSCQSESTEGSRAERFLGLYGSHDRRLYLYTLTLLPRPVHAEEVLQEANLVLWRRFDEYQCGTNFFAWACQIIRYKVLKFRERQTRAARLIHPDVFRPSSRVGS